MKVLLVLSMLLTLSVFAAAPVSADMMPCAMTPTVQALHDCVEHAVAMGAITNQGVATGLLAKLDAAQAAIDRGQPQVAVNMIKAFRNEVSAQSGKQIDAQHAEHMLMHADAVLQALQ